MCWLVRVSTSTEVDKLKIYKFERTLSYFMHRASDLKMMTIIVKVESALLAF